MDRAQVTRISRRGRRVVELGQLEPAVTVGCPYESDIDANVIESDDAVDPVALDWCGCTVGSHHGRGDTPRFRLLPLWTPLHETRRIDGMDLAAQHTSSSPVSKGCESIGHLS